MDLKVSDLLNYLPFKLKGIDKYDRKTKTLIGIIMGDENPELMIESEEGYIDTRYLSEFTPLLVPMEKASFGLPPFEISALYAYGDQSGLLIHSTAKKLHESHIDINRLIKKQLALDLTLI